MAFVRTNYSLSLFSIFAGDTNKIAGAEMMYAPLTYSIQTMQHIRCYINANTTIYTTHTHKMYCMPELTATFTGNT